MIYFDGAVFDKNLGEVVRVFWDRFSEKEKKEKETQRTHLSTKIEFEGFL